MKYYYLTFFDIGIGFQGDVAEAAYFDISNISGPDSELGRLLCSYRGDKIDDDMIRRVARWFHCVEHNLTSEQFESLVSFLERHKNRHRIEYQLSAQVPE